MDNSIYAALSRQAGLFRNLEVTANNLANVNTTGFTAENILFTEYLAKPQGGESVSMSRDVATYRDTRAGRLNATGNPLDVAIDGNGYFLVGTPQGERYTKAGSFTTDAEGFLVTQQGHQVLDDTGQPIQFEPEASEFEIGELGNIKVDGEEFGQIGVVTFQNEQALKRLDGQLFTASEIPTPIEEGGTIRVIQGALEQSNVEAIGEMTKLVELQRSVTSTAKFIETMYDLQRRAAQVYTQQS